MNYDDFPPVKLTDVGTRYTHYRDLLELWECGLVVLKESCRLDADSKEKTAQLKAGVELLRKQIDIGSGFDSNMYSDQMWSLRKLINSVPHTAQPLVDGEGEG